MKRICKLFLVTIISVVFFELFLRYSPYSSGVSPVEYDKDLGMWHKKEFSGYLIKECYKTKYIFDETGRVANSYKYDKSKKDIVLLGDSQVEALMVPNEKVMHNSLYKELDGKYNVLNYGLSGTGPSQQYQILKHKVDLSNIDTIIHFVFLENDLNDSDPKNFTSANRPKVYMKFSDLKNHEVIKPKVYDIKEKIRDFLGQFELYTYLKKSFYYYDSYFNKNDNINIEKGKSSKLINEEYKWLQLEGSIYQINKLIKAHKVKYKIIIYSAYEFSTDLIEKRNKFITFLKEHKIEYKNIVPNLKEFSKSHKLDFSCDNHWNSNTHEYLSTYLKQEFQK